jgi:phosphoglycerate dehydrogenase-like enzyme
MKVLDVNMELGELADQVRALGDRVQLIEPENDRQLDEALPQAEVVLGTLLPDQFARAARLRWMISAGAGIDRHLFPELVESEVTFVSAKGHVGTHLAEHALALLLAVTRGIGVAVRHRTWEKKWPIRDASWELTGLTLGIVGFGGTGRELARRAASFDMRILAVDPVDVQGVPEHVEACWKMDRFFELLAQSDVVAICAPLTPDTESMFNGEAFKQMPNHAILINVTRGKIVDEAALLEALDKGHIGGAGLDVTPSEPLPDDHPLWNYDNVVLTPHTAGASPLRMQRCVELVCENLRRDLAGEPLVGVIDKRLGY